MVGLGSDKNTWYLLTSLKPVFRSARSSCTTSGCPVHPSAQKIWSLVYRHVCLLNHQKTHQTFLLTPWDPGAQPLTPLDPVGPPLYPREPVGPPLGPRDPVGLSLGPRALVPGDPVGPPFYPTAHFISQTYLGQFGLVFTIHNQSWTLKICFYVIVILQNGPFIDWIYQGIVPSNIVYFN